jgi:hypothetical protein
MLLEEAGYLVDVSIRTNFEYRRGGGPDFSRYPVQPYRAGPEGRLLEIPLTSTYLGRLRRHGRWLHEMAGLLPHGRGAMARAGLVERVALTPEGMPFDKAMEAIRVLHDDGLQLFSLSYHSPSVVPGHTPYVRDASDLRAFYHWWDQVMGLLIRLGVTAASLDEAMVALGSHDQVLR